MIQTINISLIPSDNKPVINVSQFDNLSRVLRFNVFDDVEMTVPHVFDNTETVLLNIRKNDNNIVVITGVIVSDIDPETHEITEQYLTFELTEQACACVGSNYGEVSITSGDDEVIGSCNFKLIVERSPLAGGISSQTAIDNLTTQIEDITEQVIGDNYYDKEEIDGKFDDLDIPTKTSELENDSGFITSADIPTIPTKTSQLTNDSGFITSADIPTIPTKTSQLTNDSGFITSADIPTIPTKTSQLTNDSGFITSADIPTIPTKTSQLTNDSGFITASDIPTIPTKTSELTNDSGFINSTELNNVLSDYALWPTDQTTKSAIANFKTSLTKPLEFKAYIEAISGVSAVNVTECGVNFLNLSRTNVITRATSSASTPRPFTENDIWVGITRTNVFHNDYILSYAVGSDYVTVSNNNSGYGIGFPVKCKPSTNYVKSSNSTYNLGVGFYDTDGNYLSNTENATFTTPSNCYWLLIVFPTSANTERTYTNPQLELGATATAYEPYNGNTTIIQLGQTVYGGYVEQDKEGHRVLSADGVTIDLPDGTPINTLSGVNNVYADSGDIEVSYKCTIEEYINNRLSSTRTLNRAVTLEERSIEENLSETRDIRSYDNEE